MTQVTVRPALLRWALDRSRVPPQRIAKRFPNFDRWMRGKDRPTLRQLEDFAKETRTPVGFLLLEKPPSESVPIPDFRTMGGLEVQRPSPDLLETVYACQQRQEWYRDFARSSGDEPLDIVGSAKVSDKVETVARSMREALGFNLDARRKAATWSDALRMFVADADRLGILVMVNGVVGTNTHRKLDPQEFRGFALSDDLAPLVFINGADTKSAQMFTLAHELAHIWLGKTALSNADMTFVPSHSVEAWCNRVAAELLVPMDSFKDAYQPTAHWEDETKRLSREFKVSSLVILGRIRDAGGLTPKQFRSAYDEELTRLLKVSSAGGGDFYRQQVSRVGRRFATAVVASAADGNTTHRDAFRLLGVSKTEALHRLGKNLGVL